MLEKRGAGLGGSQRGRDRETVRGPNPCPASGRDRYVELTLNLDAISLVVLLADHGYPRWVCQFLSSRGLCSAVTLLWGISECFECLPKWPSRDCFQAGIQGYG